MARSASRIEASTLLAGIDAVKVGNIFGYLRGLSAPSVTLNRVTRQCSPRSYAAGQTSMIELEYTKFAVLVVDDEQDNLDAFRFVFRKSFALYYAQGGAEALAMLEGLDPAVILTDQRMPQMSGLELGRKIAESDRNVKILYMTGYSAHPLVQAGSAHEAIDILRKPFSAEELLMRIRETLDAAPRDIVDPG